MVFAGSASSGHQRTSSHWARGAGSPVQRVATTATTQIELGPETRETIGSFGVGSKGGGGKTRNAIEGLLRRGTDEAGRRE